MATSKKAPIKKAKPPTIQLADAELKAELDRVAAFLGEDAPSLLRRIIRRGLLGEIAARTVYSAEEKEKVMIRLRADHAHILALFQHQPTSQPAAPQPVANGNIVFDSFGDTEDV